MSQYLSHKLTILDTLLIVMVVYIHSYYLEAETYKFSLFLQKITGGSGLCRVANSLFFTISGYLFARNINSLGEVFQKQRKRIRTLLLPYILWNLIFVGWYVILEYTPGVSHFNNSSGILNHFLGHSVWGCLNNVFLVPAAFQLWFLRDLLGMLMLAPLLYYLAKNHVFLTVFLALGMTFVWGSVTYFWLGLLFGAQRWDIENYPRHFIYVLLAFLLYLGHAVYIGLGYESTRLVGMLVNLLGIFLVWTLYDVLARGRCLANSGIWKYICGYSFFIYCFHEPAFNIIKKLALVIFGVSEPVLILFYFVNPWLMVFMAIGVAKLMQRWVPRVYTILTGGR